MSRRKRKHGFDLRPAVWLTALIGLVLFLSLTLYTYLKHRVLFPSVVAFTCIYFLLIGFVLFVNLFRNRTSLRAEKEHEHFSAELEDFFRYVLNLPFCVCNRDGVVKLVSGELQEILHLPLQVCNIPLSDFCSVEMADIISCAKRGHPVRKITVNKDGVPEDHTADMLSVIHDRTYRLECSTLRSGKTEYFFILFRDETDLRNITKIHNETEPMVAFVVIDSLQELSQYVRVNYKSAVNEIENALKDWTNSFNGLLREYDREKYVILFRRKDLNKFKADDFPILDTVRNLKLGDKSYPVTLSIGVGAVDGSFADKERSAIDALDMALQKGGDQAVVNDGISMLVYGGKTNTMVSSTTVSSRVNSQHLCNLVRSASNVLIMGHSSPDYDSIGSCVGLYRLAVSAKEGDESDIRIVVNKNHTNFRNAMQLLSEGGDDGTRFVDGDTAVEMVKPDTLLIVSDVNNPYHTEQPKLMRTVEKIVIIDHHRRTTEAYPVKPTMTYIRPGVSAASELVTEMLEFSPYHETPTKQEANLLLSGLMLDTKNFTVSAGTETFAAAQYLYDQGASASAIRSLFEETLSSLFTAVDIDSRTRVYRDEVAITWLSLDRPAREEDTIAVAKSADKLMNVSGIEASFALLRSGSTVTISARSHEKINVQKIMESLGGGGHFDMAGAKLENITLEDACRQLKDAIDNYLDHNEESEK